MTTLYNVHIYREMRLYFPGIRAETPEEAARIASEKSTDDAEYTDDWDGDDLAALVDLVGDNGFEKSVAIDFESERLRKAAAALLAALSACVNYMADDLDESDETEARIFRQARAAIAKATGKASSVSRKPIVIEVRGGVVQDVFNVPTGIEYEIRDYDNQEETN